MYSTTSENPEEPQNKMLKMVSQTGDEKVANNNITAELSSEDPPKNTLSKNQLKKQKKLELYEQRKRERRLREREKIKQKRREAVAKGLTLTRAGPSRKELKKKQQQTPEGALRVVIDLDFDDLMLERDVAKCVKQCLRIYTINRRTEKPGRLYFTGIKPDGRIHAALKKNDGYENWNVEYHFGASYADIFTKNEIIYLTNESDVVLESLQADKVYIIGGLVDHNHHKGLCHERAMKVGVRTARLPLSEHVDMKTRTVLSTFHVFELLIHVNEGKSWTDAILQTIPIRKGAKPKQFSSSGGVGQGGENQKTFTIPKNACEETCRQTVATEDHKHPAESSCRVES